MCPNSRKPYVHVDVFHQAYLEKIRDYMILFPRSSFTNDKNILYQKKSTTTTSHNRYNSNHSCWSCIESISIIISCLRFATRFPTNSDVDFTLKPEN